MAARGSARWRSTAFTIAADPEFEIIAAERDPMRVREGRVDPVAPVPFPAASVTALEVELSAGA